MYRHINDYAWKSDQRTPEVWLLCSQPDSIPKACKSGKKIAFADPDSHPYTWDPARWLPSSGIGFCASFFDTKNPLLNQFLFSKSDQEWCKGKTFGDYYNVGFFVMQLFVGMDGYGGMSFSRPVESIKLTTSLSISKHTLALDPTEGRIVSPPFLKPKKPHADPIKLSSPHNPWSSHPS